MNKLKNILVAAALVLPAATWGAEALPFSTTFASQEEFDAWTSKAGPDAEVTDPWKYNAYSKRAEFDFSYEKKEDNYFISPAIEFTEVGAYKVEFKCVGYGSWEFVLGTDTDDLSTFKNVIQKFEDVGAIDEGASFSFNVDVAGSYNLAIHLVAETGSLFGYALTSFKVTSDKPVPALVSDLKAVPDANDELKVELSWTNPSVTTAGSNLDAITKVVILRDGEELDTLTDGMNPGGAASYTDVPANSGSYTYSVVVYDANGCSGDEPMAVTTDYVGKPMAEFPYSFTYSEYDPTLSMFTCVDADEDGTNFALDDSWYPTAFISKNSDTADNYLATPYIHLTPGYYLFSSSVEARLNSVEFGFATNRHDIPGTFVKCFEVVDYDKYSFNEIACVLVIEEEGDYCLVWHHTGLSGNSYYNEVKVKSANLDVTDILPGVATDLTAFAAPGSMDVTLSWLNPATDNGGQELKSISKIDILLGEDVIATVTDEDVLKIAEEASYTVTVEESGVLTFSVVVYNENGCSDEEAPSVTLFVGKGEEMPYTADFSQWTKITPDSSWDKWEVDGNGAACFEGLFDYFPNHSFHSPYLLMTSENTYKVTFTTFGKEEDHAANFALHAGLESDSMSPVMDFAHSGLEEQTHTVLLKPMDAATQAEDDEEAIAIPAGNVKLGFHINEKGTVYIKDFKVEQHTIQTGIENVSVDGAAALVCVDGVVTFGQGLTDVVVADLTGRVLYQSSVAPASLDLRGLGASGLVIVSAHSAAGQATAIKVAL